MSEALPLVSVIVPNYNHARFLPERLNSIRGQTFQDFELIILDDASTDNSIQVIKEELSEYPYQLIINTENSGSPCSQWLKGIAEARGSYIWVAESDDSCSEIFLEVLVSRLQPGVQLAYCRTTAINENNNSQANGSFWPDHIDKLQWQQSFTMDAWQFCQSHMVRANCIPNASSVLFCKPCRRDHDNLHRLTSDKLYAGDWIFWHYILTNSSGKVSFEYQPLCYFRSHSGTTRNAANKLREKKRFREYSDAVRYCCRSSGIKTILPGWLSLSAKGSWDWIIDEYRIYYKPSLMEKIMITVMRGPLLWAVYARLLTSRSMFVRHFGLRGRLSTNSAMIKFRLRECLRLFRS